MISSEIMLMYTILLNIWLNCYRKNDLLSQTPGVIQMTILIYFESDSSSFFLLCNPAYSSIWNQIVIVSFLSFKCLESSNFLFIETVKKCQSSSQTMLYE